jgi:hypothetical protein
MMYVVYVLVAALDSSGGCRAIINHGSLNSASVARKNTGQDACSPAPRHTVVYLQSGRLCRKSMARRRYTANHNALQLSW